MEVRIVIAVNKNDLWFCRICVASIRYYYPEVEIFLLKDELNGKFSTREIEKHYNVKLLEYQVSKFGWSAAKMHFYIDEKFKGQHFLVLDADIVFVGKILDREFVKMFLNDVIVSEEIVKDPNTEWFTNTYFDYKKIKNFDRLYDFPNYTFNCGQLFCKVGFLKKKELDPYFDFTKYPSWKRLDIFPLVDQSLFNYLLPQLEKTGHLSIGKEDYMLWFKTEKVETLNLDEILIGEKTPYLVHWAGALRTPLLNKMTRADILIFFEDYYYSKIKMGSMIRLIRKTKPIIYFQLRKIKHLLKKQKK